MISGINTYFILPYKKFKQHINIITFTQLSRQAIMLNSSHTGNQINFLS